MSDYTFSIAVAEDNEKTEYYRYGNAIDAVNAYNSFNDYGTAREVRTIVLREPNGQLHQKMFRPPRRLTTVIKRESYSITVK